MIKTNNVIINNIRDEGIMLGLTRRASKYKSSQNNERRFSTSSGITFDFSPFRSNKCYETRTLNQDQKNITYEDQSERKLLVKNSY